MEQSDPSTTSQPSTTKTTDSSPLPSPSPPDPSSTTTSKPLPLSHLNRQLPLYIHKTDLTLRHLHRLLSLTQGADTFLLTVHYTLLTLVSSIELYTRRRLRLAALALAKTTQPLLLPGETLITTIALSSSNGATQRLRALTELISDVRVFVRLWGLLGIWSWAGQTWRSPPRDHVVRAIVWAQVLANILYQALENAAYLAQHGVLKWKDTRQKRAWVWSARFWAVHVVLELVRLWRIRGLGKGEGVKGEEKEEQEKRKWWRELCVNAAYFPLTIHWSMPTGENESGGGVMSEFWVGVLGSVAGWIGVRQLWKETEMESETQTPTA